MEQIAVIGIGRLGLCFAVNLEQVGYPVLGIDTDEAYVQKIHTRQLKSNEPELEEYLQRTQRLEVSTDWAGIAERGIRLIFVLVPTPSLPEGGFDHSYLDQVAERLLQLPQNGVLRHVVVGSTTMPGYCDTLAEKLAPAGYTVSYNPEFIAQGSIIHDQQYPDQLLVGEGSPEATALLAEVYGRMCKSSPAFHVMERKSAEIAKLATNCFLTMKISFANAIGDLATQLGGEPDKILSAIGADSRINGKYLKYGFGYGGPCFPRDNRALGKCGDDHGVPLHLSRATDLVNNGHLDFQFGRLMAQPDPEVYFEDVAYKKNSDILEESQQLKLAIRLAQNGKKVRIGNSELVREKLETDYPGLFVFD